MSDKRGENVYVRREVYPEVMSIVTAYRIRELRAELAKLESGEQLTIDASGQVVYIPQAVVPVVKQVLRGQRIQELQSELAQLEKQQPPVAV